MKANKTWFTVQRFTVTRLPDSADQATPAVLRQPCSAIALRDGESATRRRERYAQARALRPGERTTVARSQGSEYAPRSTLYASRAFTLVELLVVISIIALLLGIIVPTYFSIREKAKYTKAKVTAKNLETAFKAYLDHYRVWPGELSDGTAHEIEGIVFNLLREKVDAGNNPDGITFYEFEATNSTDGALDPWSNPSDSSSTLKPYRVQVDHDYNNKIDALDLYRTVIVWSVGTNRSDLPSEPATKEGNVKSWD